jgi:dipeptide/tripeptide permease
MLLLKFFALLFLEIFFNFSQLSFDSLNASFIILFSVFC